MLDPSKLPHLQPQTQKKQEDDTPEEPLTRQIISAFSSKKGLFYLCCAFALIYITLCVQGEHLLRQGLYNALKDLGQDGFGISYQAPSSYLALKSGLNVDDLVITAPETMGSWVLKAGRVTISSTPFTPRDVTIKVNGTHSLTTKTIGDIRLIVGHGDIKLRLPYKKEPLSVVLNLKQVQTAAPKSMEGFFISDLTLTAEQVIEASEKQDNSSMRFDFRSDNVHLPAYMSRHLPPILQTAEFKGLLSGVVFNDAKSFLTGWLNSSGTVEIEKGDLLWPPFGASITGTFGLNDSFELIGAGIINAQGFFPLLDMLQNGDYLRSSRVSVAKVVLGKQIKTGDVLTSPFSVQAGKIYIGQVLLHDSKE
ncbi:MAG: DUF2125 domain-containing protein [Alphaproteobacteria bacterium]|nr:DUF2125 domain-containing protein [Alphaproteobacteria bacterium]